MPYPWDANDILTAADLNAAIGTGIVSTGLGAWTAYTPAWASSGTQPAIGNGSLSGAYFKVGRLVHWRIQMTVGSTSTFGTGTYTWTFPSPVCNLPGALGGQMTIFDASAPARFNRHVINLTGTTFSAMTEAAAQVAATVPMTWANGDSLQATGWYESTT